MNRRRPRPRRAMNAPARPPHLGTATPLGHPIFMARGSILPQVEIGQQPKHRGSEPSGNEDVTINC
jgi:hypothetical protein